jgi:hypothetical protein
MPIHGLTVPSPNFRRTDKILCSRRPSHSGSCALLTVVTPH